MGIKQKISSLVSEKIAVRHVAFALGILFVLLFFFALNRLYPAYLDDWYYCFKYTNYTNGEEIKSFWDILEGQYKHYFAWGGRSVVHTIAQFLLWIGSFWADVLNTIAYVALVLIIYAIANRSNKANVSVFILINVLIWFTLPSFSQNLLWITGSANYLWGCLIVFAFLCSFVSYYYTYKEKKGWLRNACFLLGGITAGWTNENVVVAMLFIIVGIIILLKIEKKPIPQWMIFGFIGAVIGFAIMFLAPGNFLRNKHELLMTHKMTEITPSFYFYRFVTVTKLASVYLLYPVLIYLASLALFWKMGIEDRKKKTLLLSFLFFVSSILATIAMSGSPVFPERAWFGILVLMITAIAILYANVDLSSSIVKIANSLLMLILIGFFAASAVVSFSELQSFRETFDRRERLIKEEIVKGKKDIVIIDTLFKEKNSKLTVLDLRDWLIYERDGWADRYGKYHGVESIRIYDSEEVINRSEQK